MVAYRKVCIRAERHELLAAGFMRPPESDIINTMSLRPFQAGLVCLGLVVIASVIARFTFLSGSFFDPSVAPAFGPFAIGDVLGVVAFVGGYLISRANQKSSRPLVSE